MHASVRRATQWILVYLPCSTEALTHAFPPNQPRTTDAEKSAIKKYESKFITLEPAPEYTIDRINNGLYR